MPSHDSSQQTSLFTDLAQGAVLLTVNDRLARHLHATYQDACITDGQTVWKTPDVLPLGAWLKRCHAIGLDTGVMDQPLLSQAQERQLWERVIASGDLDLALLRPAAAARSAMEAYNLLHGWQLADHPELALSPEGEAYSQWATLFDRHCHAHAGLPACRLPALLADAVRRGQLAAPPVIWLAGFDDFPPAQQTLLDALSEAGSKLKTLSTPEARNPPVRLDLPDPDTERQLAAAWALARLRDKPDARIAIVSPDIQGQRDALRQVLLDTLAPETLLPGADQQTLPFNFSLGLPLAEQPMVHDALLLLALSIARRDHDGVTQAELAQLLLSPFVGDGVAEAPSRAVLDAELKARGFPEYSLSRLAQQLGLIAPDGPLHCPRLAERVCQVQSFVDQLPAKADMGHWAGVFQQLLGLWGWPGQRSLNSREYQQNESFKGALAELASLARVSTPCGARLALAKLQQLSGDTLFQPEGSDAPVQVLGVLEAAGQHFDHLWVLGLTANQWPPAPAPNPLLPASLQRQHGMPHASAERELTFARQVMHRLAGSADDLIVSHAQRDGDGAQDVSPLIQHLPPGDVSELKLSASAGGASVTLQPLDDWLAPTAPTTLAGGTPLLGDQAACPFRAYARHRLGARPLERVSHGPDAKLLGNQVHAVLEALWREFGSLAGLRERQAAELHDLIEQTVAAVLTATGRTRPDLYSPAFVQLEQTRLTRLMRDWLETEQQREPFVVRHLEQRGTARIGPLTLKVQADRVDQLLSGHTIVVDYKTGRTTRTATWTDQRPEDPQVPLYAINQDQPVAAAVVARVRADKDAGFKGLAKSDGLLPGIKAFKGTDALADWDALQQHWRDRLSALAEEVVAGRADPTPSSSACAYCDLPPLCRVALMDGNQENSDD